MLNSNEQPQKHDDESRSLFTVPIYQSEPVKPQRTQMPSPLIQRQQHLQFRKKITNNSSFARIIDMQATHDNQIVLSEIKNQLQILNQNMSSMLSMMSLMMNKIDNIEKKVSDEKE